MSDQTDYAAFQKWRADQKAAQAAVEAARTSLPEVLHKLIAAVSWNHTADRDAAHDAVDREYKTGAYAANADNEQTPSEGGFANTDQGIAPPPVAVGV